MAEASEKSFPFDSDQINGEYDREYVADDFARYFRAFISSGIFMKNPSNLQVIANGDMSVTLKAGSIIIDGYRYENESDITIQLSPADGVLNRIDRISITWSKSDRDIHYTVQESDLSYSPQAAECRRAADFKDYVVADVYVAAGVVSINQENITDTRLNSELCGLAIAFSEIDTTALYNQIQSDLEHFKSLEDEDFANYFSEKQTEFEDFETTQKAAFLEWIESIQNILDENTAGHLQNEIDDINNELDTVVENVNKLNGTTLTGILSSGQTQLVFEDSSITSDSKIDVYTNIYGVNPKTMSATDGSLNMTFKSHSTDVEVKVVIR